MATHNLAESFNEITYQGLYRKLQIAVDLNQVIFIHGASGIGKSAIVEDFTAKNGYSYFDANLTTLESLDLRGLPYVHWESANDPCAPNGVSRDKVARMNFACPQGIPTVDEDFNKIFILFLDELPLAEPSLQNACYKLLQERMLGGKKLHPNVRIVVAGNRKMDKGNHNDIPAPLLNRCKHYTLGIDPTGWLEWAKENNIHPTILNFVNSDHSRVHVLYTGDRNEYKKAIEEGAFNTPRSLTEASKSIYYCEEHFRGNELLSEVESEVRSCIGSALASYFIQDYTLYDALPPISTVFDGTATFNDSLDMVEQFFLVYKTNTALLKLSQDIKAKGVDDYQQEEQFVNALKNINTYFTDLLTPEMLATFISDFYTVNKLRINLVKNSEWTVTMSRGKDLQRFMSMGDS